LVGLSEGITLGLRDGCGVIVGRADEKMLGISVGLDESVGKADVNIDKEGAVESSESTCGAEYADAASRSPSLPR
jgi:hypothetical protein